eukprot:jgi/Botrbrau1/22832/Bobra.0132s0155.1
MTSPLGPPPRLEADFHQCKSSLYHRRSTGSRGAAETSNRPPRPPVWVYSRSLRLPTKTGAQDQALGYRSMRYFRHSSWAPQAVPWAAASTSKAAPPRFPVGMSELLNVNFPSLAGPRLQ